MMAIHQSISGHDKFSAINNALSTVMVYACVCVCVGASKLLAYFCAAMMHVRMCENRDTRLLLSMSKIVQAAYLAMIEYYHYTMSLLKCFTLHLSSLPTLFLI